MFKLSKVSRAAGIGSAVVGGVLAPVLSAQAALPAGIETAIETAGTDLVTAGTAVVVAMVGFWGIRKVGQKLGFW